MAEYGRKAAKEIAGICRHLNLSNEENWLMKMVSSIIRPHRLQNVKEALANAGVVGLTVTDVRGAGRQKGQVERYRGSEYSIDLIPKIKLEVAAEDDQVEVIVQTIRESAYTGEIGDGKIFVYSLEDAMRIRTGDRGDGAL
jgi:nitrogen regulatory protein PII